jgi:chromosome partitioning protein
MSSSLEPPYIQDFAHFEQHVARIFHRHGWTVVTPEQNQAGYDLVVSKSNIVAAVQVKWLKNNVAAPQILKFVDFLESRAACQFNYGIFITTKDYSGPARALIKSWGKDSRIRCGIASENKITWVNGGDTPPPQPPKQEKIYFGVFTCKGGVGKTTIAAHLAGAFALQGFNVALVDLDPEQNLHKLVGDGVYVPSNSSNRGAGTTIEVYDARAWDENAARDCKIVICDCSPALERNPRELIEKFDYCIIPTTLNPLGINKHGIVIQDTVKEIRTINKNAHLFVLINNFKDPGAKRLKILKAAFFTTYKEINQRDDKFHCIDPEKVCIRTSDQLYYWGIHILENPHNPSSELAFQLIGGKCYPRDDFISLVDYIEREAGIGILRE